MNKDMCVCAKSPQSCPTLCDPMDYSPPDSSACGIDQARKLEWVDMPSSRGSSQCRHQTHASPASTLAGESFTASSTWDAGIMMKVSPGSRDRWRDHCKDKEWSCAPRKLPWTA